MTVAEIIALAQTYTSEPVTPDSAIAWLNQALVEELTFAGQEVSVSVTAKKDAWEDLPSDCREVVEILLNGESYKNDYYIRNGKIKFSDDGSYEVYYNKPFAVASDKDTPGCHVLYHPGLALYVAARQESSIDLLLQARDRWEEVRKRLGRQKRHGARKVKAKIWR